MLFEEGLIYDTHNLDLDGMAEYAKYWDKEWKILENGEFSGRITAVHTGNIQLGLTTYSLATEINGQYPEGSVLIFLLHAGTNSVVYKTLKVHKDEIVIVRSGEELDFVSSGFCSVVTICVERELFNTKFNSFFSLDSDEILEQQKFKLRKWGGVEETSLSSRLVDFMMKMQSQGTDVDFRKVEDELLEDIFASLMLEPSLPEHKKFDITKVRKYLKNNFENEVDMEHMANDFKISKRQLHSAFKNFYGLTPKKYLHILRLHEIRKYLKESSSDNASVSELAFKFGFRHLSYFTQEYKKFFHELPSITLAN